MAPVYASLIAVAGTLLGSLSTYLFQRRTAARSEVIARDERFRQDRLKACGEFAAAVTELKRAVVTAWFRRKNEDDERRKAMTEADIKGSTAEGALMTMLLLIDDAPLRGLAEAFFAHIDTLRTASSKTDRARSPRGGARREETALHAPRALVDDQEDVGQQSGFTDVRP